MEKDRAAGRAAAAPLLPLARKGKWVPWAAAGEETRRRPERGDGDLGEATGEERERKRELFSVVGAGARAHERGSVVFTPTPGTLVVATSKCARRDTRSTGKAFLILIV